MPDVKIAVARFSTPTSTGNQDWTTADLGGRTPKAIFLQISTATSDGAAAADSILSFGMTDGSSEYGSTCWDDDALASTNGKYASSTSVVYMRDSGSLITGAFVSFISDGIRINFTTVDAGNAYLCKVIFFAGDDLSASADRIAPTTLDAAIDVTGPGFEPDLLLGFWGKRSSVGTGAITSYGIAVNDGAATQKSFGFTSSASQSTTKIVTRLSSNRVASRSTYANSLYEVSDFDGSGYSLTMRSGAETLGDVFILSVNVAGLGVWAGSLDSPTATGDFAKTGIGFIPQVVGLGLSMLQAEDSNVSTGDAGALGYSVFTPDAEFCTAVASEDGASTSNTQSLSDDTAIHLTDDAGTQTHLASYSSMDSDGFTLNFSATDGTARKWFAWAVEAPATASGAGGNGGVVGLSVSRM